MTPDKEPRTSTGVGGSASGNRGSLENEQDRARAGSRAGQGGSLKESNTADSPTAPRRADYSPAGVDRKTGFFATLKRTVTEFSEDNLTDWAAALT